MKFPKKALAAMMAATVAIAGVGSLAGCADETNSITIGVYNNAGWSTEQANLIQNYAEYLNKYIVDENGDPIFNFVYSATTTLADEVNSFIAQGVDGIILLNSSPTSATEAVCAADGVPYINISTDVDATHVGSNPSEYCLGGVDPYFGDTREYGKMWLDIILEDMETRGLEYAKCSGIMFPQSLSAVHDEIVAGMEYYIETEPETYGNISMGDFYYCAATPITDYVPALLTQLEADIKDPSSAAYGTNYLLGFANGMGQIVPTLSSAYYDSSSGYYGVKMLAIGYTPNTKDALSEYVLTEAEVGIEGFVVGLVRIYNFLQGVEYTDAANYTNSDGIINVPTSWYIITLDNYDDFNTYILGGGSWDFDTYPPAITAENVQSLLGCTRLADIEAFTNRTLAEVVADNS